MELGPHADALARQLVTAAEAGGDDARALAERLLGPLESSVRLLLLDVLSAAADEITRDLAPGSVELRLRSGEPEFVVVPAPAEAPAGPGPTGAPGPAEAATGDEGATTRINLRLPEQLKGRIEEAAERAGLSVNTWVVRAASNALDADRGRAPGRGDGWGSRYTGWVR